MNQTQKIKRLGLDTKIYKFDKKGNLVFRCVMCDKFHKVIEIGDKH